MIEVLLILILIITTVHWYEHSGIVLTVRRRLRRCVRSAYQYMKNWRKEHASK